MTFTQARAKYKALEFTITFEEAKALSQEFERRLLIPGAVLKAAPKLPNGLVRDEDKTPEWRAAHYQCESIRTEYRGFNEMFARRFKKEIRAEFHAKYRVAA